MGTLNENLDWEPWMGTLNENLEFELGEQPPNQWGGVGRKTGVKWEYPSPVRKLMSFNRIMSLVKNLPTRWRENEEENRIMDQLIKNLSTDKGDGDENQKIIKCRYCR